MITVIRKARASDFSAILELIKELAKFEKAESHVTNSLEKMKNEKEFFHAYIALYDDKIIGFALYFFAYFTWVGKSLYLDDIYVKEQYRGKGIGKKLLKKIFEIAKKENCSRVRWQVLDWNKSAIEFYKKSGANINNKWLNCDFEYKDIEKFLKK